MSRLRRLGRLARPLCDRPAHAAPAPPALQALLESSGARQEIEATIQTLTDRAVEAVAEAPIAEQARAALVALARYVASREH